RTPGRGVGRGARGLPDQGDDGVLRRVVGRTGRSKVHVNGALASVGVLGQLMRGELDIAGQHAHVGLFEPSTHRAVLDRWEGVGPVLEAYRTAHAPLVALEVERQSLGGDAAAQEARAEFARFQLDELERLAPSPGEEPALEAERRRLAAVERLRAAARDSEAPRGAADAGVRPAPGGAARRPGEAARPAPTLGEAAASVISAAAALEDALRSLRRYLDGLEADPERLAMVEERLDALRRL